MQDLWTKAAQRNVEANLGNLITDDSSDDDFSEEIYTLALDGALDAGADWDSASTCASQVLSKYAVNKVVDSVVQLC